MILRYSSIVILLTIIFTLATKAQTNNGVEVHGFSEFNINEPLNVTRISQTRKISETDSSVKLVYMGDCCQKFINDIDIEQIQLLYAKEEPNNDKVLRLKRITVLLDTLTLRGRLNGTLPRSKMKPIDIDKDTSKAWSIANIYTRRLEEKPSGGGSRYNNHYLKWDDRDVEIRYYFNWLGQYFGSAPFLIYDDPEFFLQQIINNHQ